MSFIAGLPVLVYCVLIKYLTIKHFQRKQGQSFKSPDGEAEVRRLGFSINGEGLGWRVSICGKLSYSFISSS